jgi:hypothetical protein
MALYCRHRAENALESHWHRPVTLKESTTLVTALTNKQSSASHEFLMKNIEMHMSQAQQIYDAHAPHVCHCDAATIDDSDMESKSQIVNQEK